MHEAKVTTKLSKGARGGILAGWRQVRAMGGHEKEADRQTDCAEPRGSLAGGISPAQCLLAYIVAAQSLCRVRLQPHGSACQAIKYLCRYWMSEI